MAATFSKLAPKSVTKDKFKVLSNAKCCELMHTETQSCLVSSYNALKEIAKGSSKFFMSLYLLQLVLHGKNINTRVLKEVSWGFCRSMGFGITVGTSFVASSCLFRQLLGRYTYHSIAMVPAAIAGFLGIFLDTPRRRRILINSYLVAAMEYYLNTGGWRLPLLQETSLFMLLSALLMYQLRTAADRSKLYWFFIPPRSTVQVLGQCCPHAGPCWKDIVQGGAKYAALAVTLQLGKIFLSMDLSVVTEPKKAKRRLFSKPTLTLSLSLGGYVFIYKAIHCLLCRRFGKDHPIFDAVAGLFAGSVYALEPRIDGICSAVVAVLTLLLRRSSEKTFLKKVPTGELLFALCNGIWFHARTMGAANCPPILTTVMDTGSNNLCRKLQTRFVDQCEKKIAEEKLNEYSKKNGGTSEEIDVLTSL